MIQFKTRLITLILTLFVAEQAYSQRVITLEEALNYALDNSEVIRQARLDIENVKQKVVETRANALPQINLTSSISNNLIVQQFVLPAEAFGGPPGQFMAIKAGQTWNAMSQVQFSQQLFNQQVFTGLKAAKGSVEFYRLAAEISEENVIQQVAALFYQIIISHEKVKVIDANLQRIIQLEEIVTGQYETGLATKIDRDRIRVNRSNLETQKLQLENGVVQQENLLKYYMGMPVGEEITIADNIENLDIKALDISQDSVKAKELNSFLVLKKQKELLSLQRKADRAEGFPTLSLGANYTYNTQSGKLNLYGSNALNYDMSAVNLTLRVPIFDGFARSARGKQTEFQLLKLQEDMDKTLNALNMAYENAKNQIKTSLQAINTQKANMELAEEVFRSTQANYKNGLASLTDLLNAETELVTAQNSYNEALLNYKVAETELMKAKGEIKSLLKK